MQTEVTSNVSFGDVCPGFFSECIGFSTEDDARNCERFAEIKHGKENWGVGGIILNYAYREGRWVLESIDSSYENGIKDTSILYDLYNNLHLNPYWREALIPEFR